MKRFPAVHHNCRAHSDVRQRLTPHFMSMPEFRVPDAPIPNPRWVCLYMQTGRALARLAPRAPQCSSSSPNPCLRDEASTEDQFSALSAEARRRRVEDHRATDVGLSGQLVRVDHLDGDERVPVLEPHSGLGSVHAVDETRDCAFLRVCARAFGALGRRAPGFLGRDQGTASGFAALARLLARALTNPPVHDGGRALPLCDLEGVALLLCDLEGVVPHPTDARCRRSAREDGARLAAALGVAGGHEDHGPLAAGTAAASTSAPCGRKGCSGASVRVGWIEEDRVTRLQDATLHPI